MIKKTLYLVSGYYTEPNNLDLAICSDAIRELLCLSMGIFPYKIDITITKQKLKNRKGWWRVYWDKSDTNFLKVLKRRFALLSRTRYFLEREGYSILSCERFWVKIVPHYLSDYHN